MKEQGFALFDTCIGHCGIAWGERGIIAVQLPEAKKTETRARLERRFPGIRPGTPPPAVSVAIERITALLRGEPSDLSVIELDMADVPPFHRRVYALARKIRPGATLSYGEVATRIGAPGAARAVGQALGKNPFAIVVPCHRVLAAGGKVGGFSAVGGVTTKLRMLALEGTSSQPATRRAREDVFDFDPVTAASYLRKADATLAKLIDSVGPCRMQLKQTPSIFGALAEAIVYQQLNGKAAGTIFARVCALFPKGHAGPTAEQILAADPEKLRAAGLSRAKLASLVDLAERAQAGEIPTLAEARRLPNEAVIERLTHVRGIGRWTVEMLLMFRLGRADVLPVDDYGVRKGYAVAYKKKTLPSPKELAKLGERWKPYRTVASWYFWRAAELAKPPKPVAARRPRGQ